MKRYLLFMLVCHSLSATQPPNFQQFLDQWRSQHHVTSVVVSIEEINTYHVTTYVSGTTQHNNTPVTMKTVYGVGSISKTFVAAALLQLQQEGKLSLDNPIGAYFPQYPRWKTITIRQLLNMTSGIQNTTELPLFKKLEASLPTQPISPVRLIDMAYRHPDYFSPGKGWHYSNTNYFLAGLLIEKVTHQSLAEVYEQRFVNPLSLHHTFYSTHFYPTSVERQMAHAYIKNQDITHFNSGLPGAAGAMVMNSQDLLTWIHALFTPGKILSQSSLQQLTTTIKMPSTPPKPSNAHYGLGIYSMVIPDHGMVWWYTGVIKGYTSAFVWIPSKNRIVVVQVASWPKDHFEILFPNQVLMQKIFSNIGRTRLVTH